MNIVPARNTGGPNWVAERFAALQEHGITGPVARAIVAHWGLETGFGKGEWNYNVGNIIAVGDQPRLTLEAGDGPVSHLRAYESLAEGVAAYLALLQSTRYAGCLAKLQANPTSSEWIDCLGIQGYYTAPRPKYVKGYEGAFARISPPVAKVSPDPVAASVDPLIIGGDDPDPEEA